MDSTSILKPTSLRRTAFVYVVMIGGAALVYQFIRSYGETLDAPASAGAAASPIAPVPSAAGIMLHFLLALMVVIAVTRALGALFRVLQQPPVVGEIIGGIILGPSLLGRVAPEASSYLFPSSIAPFLDVISQVGVILYMFVVGLELDPTLLRKRGHATVAVSHASIIAPFLLGGVLALVLYPKLSSSAVPFTNFALFLSVSMSVTAFPVLARILTDRGIHRSRMGTIALTCAAVDDVTGWCLLAMVVSIVQARTAGALSTIGMALIFIAAMTVVARPAMVRLSFLYGNRGLTQGIMAGIFVILLLSALTTHVIGIQAIFGAFALGAIIPHDSSLARELTDRLEDLVIVLLLPVFFAFTGLRTQIGLVNGTDQWLLCALIIAVASIGKFGGGATAARLAGLGWRESLALGVLMNTRGLMELILLNIGYELKVISPTLFAMLVLMALVTTFATTPILHLVTAEEELLTGEPSRESAAKLRLVRPTRQGILVPVSNPAKVGPLLDLALAATGPDDSPPRVVALVRRPLGGIRSGLREVEQRVVPHSPALATALEYALERQAAIVPHASWSDHPARDLVRMAAETRAAWILVGFHRPIFGADYRGGMVREILEGVALLPINVGIVVNTYEEPCERISVLVDHDLHGWASLDLATRIALRKNCDLYVLSLPARSGESDSEVEEMLNAAAKRVPHVKLKSLKSRTARELENELTSRLVVMGRTLADELMISGHLTGRERCTIVVQGASAELSHPAAAGGVSSAPAASRATD